MFHHLPQIKGIHQQQFNFVVFLCLQVAHIPAAPHPGPDHLPAGLSGTGQAVPLAAHNVSIYPVTLGYFTATSYLFVHMKSGNLFLPPNSYM